MGIPMLTDFETEGLAALGGLADSQAHHDLTPCFDPIPLKNAAVSIASDDTSASPAFNTEKPAPLLAVAGLPNARITSSVAIPLPNGATPTLSIFSGLVGGSTDHFALTFAGEGKNLPIVRLHSSCVTGDILRSMRCDCGPQLDDSIERLSLQGGHLLYLLQEGRGIGFASKIAAYQLQDQGFDTFEANRRLGLPDDRRDYCVAAQMLFALGVRQIRLLTNNPDKVTQLRRWGIEVISIEPTVVSQNDHNRRYLAAKRDLAGHNLALAPAFCLEHGDGATERKR